jgi:aminopeptidase N
MFVFLLAAVSARAQDPAPEAFRARHAKLELAIDYAARRLSGSITYDLENWTAQPAGHISFLVSRLMDASAVHDGRGTALSYTQDVVRFRDDPMRQVTQVHVTLPWPIAGGGQTTVRIDYAGNLVGYTEVGWLYVRDRIDTAFTIIREDAFAFPVIGGLSAEVNRKRPRGEFTYDAAIRVPARYLVATGGELTRTPHDDETVTWRYVSERPSPFLNVSVAPFDTIVDGGVHLFHFHADSLGARRTMTNAQSALRLLAKWFGPQRTTLNLTITEIPDGWGSQASLVGGIIQAAIVFRDSSRSGELYHELSHLWNARDTDTPSPRWNEGLASFLEDLLRERVDGWTGRRESETRTLAWMQKQTVADSLLRVTPMLDYGRRGMTDYSYSVGELMFATLHELVGEEQFNKIVGGYYQQFANGGSTRDFAAFAKRTASRNLEAFCDDWILTPRWVEVVRTAPSIGDLANHYRGPPP